MKREICRGGSLKQRMRTEDDGGKSAGGKREEYKDNERKGENIEIFESER